MSSSMPVVSACAAFQTDPTFEVWRLVDWDVRTCLGTFRAPTAFGDSTTDGPTAEEEFQRFYFRHAMTGRTPALLSSLLIAVVHLYFIVSVRATLGLRGTGCAFVVASLVALATPSSHVLRGLNLFLTRKSPSASDSSSWSRELVLAVVDERRSVAAVMLCIVGNALYAAATAEDCGASVACVYRAPALMLFANVVWSLFFDMRVLINVPLLLLSTASFAVATLLGNPAMHQPGRAVPFSLSCTVFVVPAVVSAHKRETRLRERFRAIVSAQLARNVVLTHNAEMGQLIHRITPRALWSRLQLVMSLDNAVLIDHSQKALVAVASVPTQGRWASSLVPMDVVRAMHAVFCRFDYELHRARLECASIDRAVIAGDTYVVVGDLHGLPNRWGQSAVNPTAAFSDALGSSRPLEKSATSVRPFLSLCLSLAAVSKEIASSIDRERAEYADGTAVHSRDATALPLFDCASSRPQTPTSGAELLQLCVGVGVGDCWGGIHGRVSQFRYLIFGEALEEALQVQSCGPIDRSTVLVTSRLSLGCNGGLAQFSNDVLPTDRCFIPFALPSRAGNQSLCCWEILARTATMDPSAADAFTAHTSTSDSNSRSDESHEYGNPFEDVPAERLSSRIHDGAAPLPPNRDTAPPMDQCSLEPMAPFPEELVTLTDVFRKHTEVLRFFETFKNPDTAAAYDAFAVDWEQRHAVLLWGLLFCLPLLTVLGVMMGDLGTAPASVGTLFGAVTPMNLAAVLCWVLGLLTAVAIFFVQRRFVLPLWSEVLLLAVPFACLWTGVLLASGPSMMIDAQPYTMELFAPAALLAGRRQSWLLKASFVALVLVAPGTAAAVVHPDVERTGTVVFAALTGGFFIFIAWKVSRLNRDTYISGLLSALFLDAAQRRTATRERLIGGLVPSYLLESISRRIVDPTHSEQLATDASCRSQHDAEWSPPPHRVRDSVPAVSRLSFVHPSVGGSFWQRCLPQPDPNLMSSWSELCVATIRFHPIAFDVDRAMFRLQARLPFCTQDSSNDVVVEKRRESGRSTVQTVPGRRASRQSDDHRRPSNALLPPMVDATLGVLDTVDVIIAEHHEAYLRNVRVLGDSVTIAGPIGEPKEPENISVSLDECLMGPDGLEPLSPEEAARKRMRIYRERYVVHAAAALIRVLQSLHSRGGRTFTAALVTDSAIGAVVGDEATTIHHCVLGVATRNAETLLRAAPLLDSSVGPLSNKSTALALETFRRTHDRHLIAEASRQFVKHSGASMDPLDARTALDSGTATLPSQTLDSTVFGQRMRWSLSQLGNVDVYPVALESASLHCSPLSSDVSLLLDEARDEGS